MRRRDFLRVLCGAGVLWPVTAGAQQTKMHRVAYLSYAAPVSELTGANPINPFARAFLHGLRSLGYVEGQDLIMEWRNAEGRLDRVPEIVRELVSVNVDVIVVGTVPLVRAAKAVTQTIPIIMVGTGNPVEEGLIESLARPGGNVTGLAGVSGNENAAKRLQVLKELLPGMSRVALLNSKAERIGGWEQSMEVAARQLGISVLFVEHTPTDYAAGFALIERERPDALSVAFNAANMINRHLIIEFAAKNRLPAMYGVREFAANSGLISYGPNYTDIYKQAAGYVDRILKGAKLQNWRLSSLGDFQLVINSKTAKVLGLTIPPHFLPAPMR